MSAERPSDQHDPAMLKALAEASAWIVTLHGPDRTEAVDRGFKRWMEEAPVHARAFEHATDTWVQAKASVRRSAYFDVNLPPLAKPQALRFRSVWPLAASLAGLIAGAALYLQHPAVSTGVGERRQLVLDDGTQVSMNTATRLVKHYSASERRIELEAGEVLFDVVADSSRPFVVVAGDREVRALGTSFLVRRDDERLAVTLVDGKVAIASVDATGGGAGLPAILEPGERVTFNEHHRPKHDRPQLEKLTAWQQGLVNIDNLTLIHAVSEMNRYSTTQLVVEGPAADIRVSGVFRITDSQNMARAVAMTHGLKLREEGRRIVLSGSPQAPGKPHSGSSRSPQADK
jgi:transmembrane sensor